MHSRLSLPAATTNNTAFRDQMIYYYDAAPQIASQRMPIPYIWQIKIIDAFDCRGLIYTSPSLLIDYLLLAYDYWW